MTHDVQKTVTICNQRGLHARAAAKFVKTAGRYEADICVARGETEVCGVSIMGLLTLAASKGCSITITAKGEDAEAAVSELAELVDCAFGEDC